MALAIFNGLFIFACAAIGIIAGNACFPTRKRHRNKKDST